MAKRKSVVICFLCSAASLAYGQESSSLRLYGRLDLSAQHVSLGNGRSVNQLNDGTGATSAIGFRGSEDLGGGLSAFFDLETKVLQDTGAAGASSSSGTFITTSQGFFSRNSYVGLKSNTFGTLTLGRYYTSIVNAIFSMNVIRTGINTGLATGLASQGIGSDFWNNNQIRYDAPTIGGADVSFNVSPGEVAGSFRTGATYGGGLTYKVAGFLLAGGAQTDNDILPTGKKVNWNFVTVNYSFSGVKLMAGMDRVHNAGKIAGWTDSRLYTGGVAYEPIPLLTLALQYNDTRETATGTSSKQTTFNAHYFLSKRTALYALATRTKSGNLALMPLYVTPGNANTTASGVALGLQHYF